MSLNNEGEKTEDIFRSQGIKAEVVELMDPGEEPSESLRKNIKRLERCDKPPGQKVCDTMVISGIMMEHLGETWLMGLLSKIF